MLRKILPFIEKTFGPYPYKQYSFIHGGDGGMEYPMATLLGRSRCLDCTNGCIAGTRACWQPMNLIYAWMDEGFTQYAAARNWGFLNKDTSADQTFKGEYTSYFRLAKSNLQEPLTTYADYFNTNAAYGASSYSKGPYVWNSLDILWVSRRWIKFC